MYEHDPLTLSFRDGEQERTFQEEYSNRFRTQIRLALTVGVFLYAVFGLLDRILFPQVATKLWLIRYGIVCPAILLGIFSTKYRRFDRWTQPLLSVLAIITGLGIIAMSFIAPPPDNAVYYAGLILVIMTAFTFLKLRFIYATFASLIIVLTYEVVGIWFARTPLNILVSNNFFFIAANVVGMFAGYFIELYVRKEFVQRHLLAAEEVKTKMLLLSILPEPIAERLKQGQTVIVDKFQHATVLFADIVGFTNLAAQITPEALVIFLNDIFSILDAIAEKYELEKIKTIGDGYMLAGGLPMYRTDHAEAIADMALDAQEQISQLEAAKDGWLRLRIGIHSGPVVAGVIGKKKFSYDLWGNTVNVASRMEKHSFGGCILCSHETYLRLRSTHILLDRGPIDVKGKGSMRTYLLVGRKPNGSSGSSKG
jgi:class 3 adenylate cyclase